MTVKQWAMLLILAAIWGGSFIFMKVLSPALGAIPAANARVLIAGVVLIGWFAFKGRSLEWRKNWKQFLLIGTVNAAIPFSMFSFAALHIPASYSVILNATTPLFGAVLSGIFLAESFTPLRVFGLLLGCTGVFFVVDSASLPEGPMVGLALAACLVAAACYAIASVYIKLKEDSIESDQIAAGCQFAAGLVLLPLSFTSTTPITINPLVIGNVLAISLLSSGLAFILFYRLLRQIGPTKAMTVTFLMPVFGIVWSMIFLGESLSLRSAFGCLLVLMGTALVVSKISIFTTGPARFLKKKADSSPNRPSN